MVKQGWYILPGTSYEIPMPPRDLAIALITVLAMLPAVIIISKIIGLFTKKPAQKQKQH